MVLMIDNYDSFTYNLVQYLGELACEVQVHRNDAISVEQIENLAPEHIVISPGPGTPADAGITRDLLARLGGRIPILGVCLGHQAIAEVWGGQVVRATTLVHGKSCAITHAGQGLFRGLPSPFQATRYHSLVVERETLPSELEVTAWSDEGLIMGLRHRRLRRLEGVQFHPESILTEHGKDLLANFLAG